MIFLQLALAATALALPHYSGPQIAWTACNQTEVNTTDAASALCGTFPVPLDYSSNRTNETLVLQLVKVLAPQRPARGSIQLNLGGPGLPTRQGLVDLGYTLLNLTGGQYDLVGFDPRGTGNTLPVTCAQTDLQAQSLLAGVSTNANSSDTALGGLWAGAKIMSATCARANNETKDLEVIGTAFVARDLISVVDALGEDGMLRYWGLSYGTTLGATVAAMFPERIDKLILDGVQNPHEYYNAFADFEEWTQTDYVFSSLFETCVAAGPEACSLAALNMTGPELEAAFWERLEELKFKPLVVGQSVILDYTAIKGWIVSLLYDNAGWSAFTDTLALFLSPDFDESILDNVGDLLGDTGATTPFESLQTYSSWAGIHCGDRRPRTEDFEVMVDVYEELTNVSRVFGDAVTGRELVCARWQAEAKERYAGDFQARTANPILIIGNTGDAFTPLKSAYNVSSGFEGSVVLETDGFGHCSTSVPSSCVLEHVSRYWLDGILPANGTRCEVEAVPFANVTWADIFAQTPGNGTVPAKRSPISVGGIPDLTTKRHL